MSFILIFHSCFFFFFIILPCLCFFFFFFNDTATTEIYTLSLHDALPISLRGDAGVDGLGGLQEARARERERRDHRSEEHTSELQSLAYLVCRLLLEKKKKTHIQMCPQRRTSTSCACSTSRASRSLVACRA